MDHPNLESVYLHTFSAVGCSNGIGLEDLSIIPVCVRVADAVGLKCDA